MMVSAVKNKKKKFHRQLCLELSELISEMSKFFESSNFKTKLQDHNILYQLSCRAVQSRQNLVVFINNIYIKEKILVHLPMLVQQIPISLELVR